MENQWKTHVVSEFLIGYLFGVAMSSRKGECYTLTVGYCMDKRIGNTEAHIENERLFHGTPSGMVRDYITIYVYIYIAYPL